MESLSAKSSDMRKIFPYVLALALCLPVLPAASQDVGYLLAMSNSGRDMVTRSAERGLMVICQEYQLEDSLSHRRYSLDGNPYFSRKTAFAVKTAYGLITAADALRPWVSEAEYKRYEGSCYRPVVSRTSVLTAKDSVWRESSLISLDSLRILKNTDWVCVRDTVCNDGFVCDSLRDGANGWIVWLVSEQKSGRDSLSLETRMAWNVVNDAVIDSPAVSGTVCGGVFLTVDYGHIGQIVLKLCGILSPSGSEWKVSSAGHFVEENTIRSVSEFPELTLVPETPSEGDQAGKALDSNEESAKQDGDATDGGDDARKNRRNKKKNQ